MVSFVIFQGPLTSSFEKSTTSQAGYGVKSNDNIASMEQANQLSDHPLAIDAVNMKSRFLFLSMSKAFVPSFVTFIH